MRFAALMMASLLAFAACDGKSATETSAGDSADVVKFSGKAMGTTWSVLVVDDGADGVDLEAAITKEIDVVEDEMSHYRAASEISRFNAHEDADWFPVSTGFARVVSLALIVGAASGGAFDVTLGPVIDAWGFGKERHRHAPTAAQLTAARALTGHEHLAVQEHPAAIKKALPSLALNLSAIAKGHGVDRVAMLLEARGVDDYLVEIGGEIRVAGEKKPGVQWKVAIERPRSHGRELDKPLPMATGAVATSGDYRIFWMDENRRYSHLIDPRSGRPTPHALASASVFAPTCAEADAWATTMMILGPDDALSLAEKLDLPVMLIVRIGEGRYEQRTSRAYAERIAK